MISLAAYSSGLRRFQFRLDERFRLVAGSRVIMVTRGRALLDTVVVWGSNRHAPTNLFKWGSLRLVSTSDVIV